ncbi:MAG: PKD domain-containing protein [Bacteroidota bacterium]
MLQFKLNYSKWITVLCLIPTTLFGQLSGTKVIGTAPSDYTTFSAAVTALNSSGISNSVVFQVKPGTYNEQISIGAVNGTAANKTITFESLNHDSTSVILQFNSSATASNNYVLRLNGTDYVTFRQMTIQRTDTLAYAQVVDISSGATHNTFSNNIIKGTTKANLNTYCALIGSTNALEDSYNVFTQNKFLYGSFGFYYLGQGSTMPESGTQITYNTFSGQNYRAIYMTSQRSAKINNNIISTASANSNYVGIYGQYANDSLRILKNRLDLSTGTGIYLANCNETSSIRGLIANNFIAVGGTSTAHGISLNNVKLECIYNNSIHIYSSSAASGRALFLNGSITATLYIINNVLANTGGGYCYYADATTGTPVTSSNYNDLYTTGSYVGSWKSAGNTALLSDWRTASSLDANSVSADPLFTSASDLHASSGTIHGAGTAALLYFSITDDIDNQSRSNPPDIGADEFNIEDLGISAFDNIHGICPGIAFHVTVFIKNFGSWPFSGSVPVFYLIQGSPVVNATTPSITLNPGDSTAFTFSQTENIAIPGAHSITAGTTLAVDINTSNDNTADSVRIFPYAAASAGPDVPVCTGDSATLTATGGTGYTWNTTPPSSNPTITVLVADTTLFSVTVISSDGCSATDSAYVFPALFPKPVAGFSFMPSNLQTSFTNTSTDALTYLWDFGDGNTDNTANPVHTYTATGNYIVTLYAINPCDSDTITQNLTLNSIDENGQIPAFNISPNPAVDYVRVSVNILNETIKSAEISDVTGRFACNISITDILNDRALNVSKLANGMYFLKIYTSAGLRVVRFIINR